MHQYSEERNDKITCHPWMRFQTRCKINFKLNMSDKSSRFHFIANHVNINLNINGQLDNTKMQKNKTK